MQVQSTQNRTLQKKKPQKPYFWVSEKEAYLSSEDIQSKSIETTNHSLLDVQSQVVQSPHRGKQETWSAGTKHVDIDSSPFPYLNLHL
jgi:hypothetical protein